MTPVFMRNGSLFLPEIHLVAQNKLKAAKFFWENEVSSQICATVYNC